jgi:hypothetical protein
MARTGPTGSVRRCPFLGVDRKWLVEGQNDANDPERSCATSREQDHTHGSRDVIMILRSIESPMRRFILPIFLIATFSAPCVAQVQPGSTGGTIGKQDKSISGGEEPSKPSGGTRQPGHSTTQRPDERQTLPQRIRLIQGSYSATLRHLGGNAYQATWNNAVVSRMTVTMTTVSMTIQRQDISSPVPFWSVTYSGTRTGNTASGTFNTHSPINGAQGSWEASW